MWYMSGVCVRVVWYICVCGMYMCVRGVVRVCVGEGVVYGIVCVSVYVRYGVCGLVVSTG